MIFYKERLAELIKTRGLRLQDVADGLDCTIQYISALVRGTKKRPHDRTIYRLAEFFKVPVEFFARPPTVMLSDMEHLPLDLQAFLAEKDSLPYLVAAMHLKAAGVSADRLESLVKFVGG